MTITTFTQNFDRRSEDLLAKDVTPLTKAEAKQLVRDIQEFTSTVANNLSNPHIIKTEALKWEKAAIRLDRNVVPELIKKFGLKYTAWQKFCGIGALAAATFTAVKVYPVAKAAVPALKNAYTTAINYAPSALTKTAVTLAILACTYKYVAYKASQTHSTIPRTVAKTSYHAAKWTVKKTAHVAWGLTKWGVTSAFHALPGCGKKPEPSPPPAFRAPTKIEQAFCRTITCEDYLRLAPSQRMVGHDMFMWYKMNVPPPHAGK